MAVFEWQCKTDSRAAYVARAGVVPPRRAEAGAGYNLGRSEPSHFPAPLDPDFQPAVLFNRNYVTAAMNTCRAVPLVLGLERENGLVSRYETVILPGADEVTARYVERLVKFLLWSRGGWRLHVGGPKPVGDLIRRVYGPRGARRFDWQMMAAAYGRRFEVVTTTPEHVPGAQERQLIAGGYRRGCRIGFDLGSAEYTVAAVAHGQVVFLQKFPWDPRPQTNLNYHYHHISGALHRAAASLPRVDAIGVSATGIVVDNQLCVTSLFRSVQSERLAEAKNLLRRLQREWQVPLLVMNDGDVAALAGGLSLDRKGMLGIAMGAAEAGGFTDRQGNVQGWLNELAFVPVDYNPSAPADPWSGDRGTGMMYFSQQAVNKLMPAAGIAVARKAPLAERVQTVLDLVRQGDRRAMQIYETIGVYLGYALAHCAEFYDFQNAMILGGVMAGGGRKLVLHKAEAVLKREFPELAARIELRVPDEASQRVSLAVAAASLPSLRQ